MTNNFVMANRSATCGYEISNGNVVDPDYAYCGHPAAHAGDHGDWKV